MLRIPLPREPHGSVLRRLLRRLDLDDTARPVWRADDGTGWGNAVFQIRPADPAWGLAGPANFHHRPSGLAVAWSDRVLVGGRADRAIEADELARIVADCIASVPNDLQTGAPAFDTRGRFLGVSYEGMGRGRRRRPAFRFATDAGERALATLEGTALEDMLLGLSPGTPLRLATRGDVVLRADPQDGPVAVSGAEAVRETI